MPHRPPRPVSALALCLGLGTGLACTAILQPRDEVERCGSVDDCPPTGDNRYEAVCKFDEDADLDSTEVDKICVAEFKTPNCNPMMGFNPDDAYPAAFEQLSSASRYEPCSETPGARGCPPEPGVGCMAGLVAQPSKANPDITICDDSDPNTPAAVAVTSGIDTAVLFGQDIKDQYCRSFFCDDSFVCDGRTHRCVPCNPDEPFGEGGCFEVYSGGVKSCIYLEGAALQDACMGPDVEVSDFVAGDCN